jgi:O-methyltransferase
MILARRQHWLSGQAGDRIAMTDGRALYLELLKKVITDTVYKTEPDHDNQNTGAFVPAFTFHYIRGTAVSMLPATRLDNIRDCIMTILRDGIPGDLIETGVWRGGACIYMRGVLKSSGINDRTVWVADSFEGLPEPDASQHPREAEFFHSPLLQKGYQRMAASLEEVKCNFQAFGLLDQNVSFIKGWFEQTLPNAPIKKLALLRVDGDYYQSTMAALNALYDRISPGGFVIVDDYGEDLWTNCREAVDDFRQSKNITEAMQRVDSKCVFWQKKSVVFA